MVMSHIPRTLCNPYSVWGNGSGGSGGPPPGGPPVINVQPSNQTVTAPSAATFTVIASNPAGMHTLTYQWRMNGVPIGGATSASYTTTATTTAMTGQVYSVQVFNESGSSAVSSNATLTVNPASAPTAPTITSHPANATKLVGDSVSFSVTASGTTPFTYQWQEYVSAWADIPSGTNATAITSALVLTNVQQGTRLYRCVVTNSQGSATSNYGQLIVNTPVSNVTAGPAEAVIRYATTNPVVNNTTAAVTKYAETAAAAVTAAGVYTAGWSGGVLTSFNQAQLISPTLSYNDKIEHEVYYTPPTLLPANGGDGQLVVQFRSTTVAGWASTTFAGPPTAKVLFSELNLTSGADSTGTEKASTMMIEVYEGLTLKGTPLKICSDVTSSANIPAGYTKISVWKASLALGGAAGPWVYQVGSLTNPTPTNLQIKITIFSAAIQGGPSVGTHTVNNITVNGISVVG